MGLLTMSDKERLRKAWLEMVCQGKIKLSQLYIWGAVIAKLSGY
jgi:hypothetical protein